MASSNSNPDDLSTLRAVAISRIESAPSADALRTVEGELLGRKSALVDLNKALGSLDIEARKAAGAAINEVRGAIEAAVAARRGVLVAAERADRIAAERIDLTEIPSGAPHGRPHLVTSTIEELEDIFIGMGFSVFYGSEAETDWYNFEALNFPPGHPARSMHDTFQVALGEPGDVVLRTHTSPMQIHIMQEHVPPIYAVVPGRCYRRDTPDARHLHTFHQIEALVIDKGISLGHLAGTIDTRPFPVPDPNHAIHSRLAALTQYLENLRTENRRRRQVFVEARLKMHVERLQLRARTLQCEIVAAQRRPFVTGDVAAGPEPGAAVKPHLVHRQAHQCLDTSHVDAAGFEVVLIG